MLYDVSVRGHPAPWDLKKCLLTCIPEETPYEVPKHSNGGESVSSDEVSFTKGDSKAQVFSLSCKAIDLQTQLAHLTSAMQCMANPIQSQNVPTVFNPSPHAHSCHQFLPPHRVPWERLLTVLLWSFSCLYQWDPYKASPEC